MSTPVIGGALWTGNQQLATRRQLISTSQGLFADINDLQISSISQVSTITATQWMSSPVLYVSDIQGIDLTVSSVISTSVVNTSFISISSLSFKGASFDVDVSFDLGLGEAVGGFLAGLGALVGGGLIAVGTGVGLAVQGAEQGIATIIAGRPQNFINSNVYETINFTSQLQVSTIGFSADPVYSSIFRTVSSVAADSVPGKEIFTSTLFYPGQICVRSVSDPFNLITPDSNVNTSTIQSFGQWVPLQGLEPENIVANSISTNFISAGQSYIGIANADLCQNNAVLASNYLQVGVITGNPGTMYMTYSTNQQFEIGATKYANLVGLLQNFYIQSEGPIIYTQPGTTTENASLYLGTAANESLFNVSSIFARGQIQGNSAIFSSIIAESLTVVSTINLQSTNVENITSSATAIINEAFIEQAYISTMSSFTFQTGLGNPLGPFDITKYDTVVSTSYNQVSSLTQNILSYTLEERVNDQTVWNLNAYETNFGILYKLNPGNQSQWASTVMLFNDYQNPGGIELPVAATFSTIGFTGVFDVQTQYNPNTPNYYAPFYVQQDWIPGSEFSTFSTFLAVSAPNPPSPPPQAIWRFNIGLSGWIESVQLNPSPFQTSNTNIFQISQDINDTYIRASDRLHLQAGDIYVDGVFNLSNVNTQTIDALDVNTGVLNAGVVNAPLVSTNCLYEPNFYTGSINTIPPFLTLSTFLTVRSTDFTNIRQLTIPSRGPNIFGSFNSNEWNNTTYVTPVGTNATTGPPAIYLGDLIDLPATPLPSIQGQFWVGNNSVPAQNIPVYLVKSGSWLSTLGFIGTTGTGYTKVSTIGVNNWALYPNQTNPQGLGGYTYSNCYNIEQLEYQTSITSLMPIVETVPSKTILANKIILGAQQIRTLTFNSPSFPTREAGFEYASYFDANVVFTGTQSDAENIIVSQQGSLGYSVIGWMPILWFGRMRTESLGIQGFEIEAVVVMVPGSGTFADFIWASHRYINVNGPDPEANIRENYLMIPYNWSTYQNLVGPY